jgi:hypothetical protein
MPCEPYTIEGDEESEGQQAPKLQIITGKCHEGQVAPDGTLIDTRRKREEYKRRAGVEDESDCREFVQKRKREREAFFLGEQPIGPYREAAAEAFRELRETKGRGRDR